MTSAFLKNTKDGVIIKIKGHAERTLQDKDFNLACAYITAISFTAYNAFEEMYCKGLLREYKAFYRDGYIFIRLTAQRRHLKDVRCYMHMLRTGLCMIADMYPNSIKVVG